MPLTLLYLTIVTLFKEKRRKQLLPVKVGSLPIIGDIIESASDKF